MKKLSALFILFAMVLSLVACGNKKPKGFEIPDVFGLNYTDATSILEGEGFTVTAIESKVDSFSEKLLTPLENVEKGTVFKVDEYILDGDGDINENYDWVADGELFSDDQSLVIYYAKEDYVLPEEEPESEDNNTESKNTESKVVESDKETTVNESKNTSTTKTNELGSEFKAAMDSYENFIDEYVDFMKKYTANPTDLSILTDYSDYMSKYSDFVTKFEKWENEDLNTAELAYYVDVQARVSKKLLEVAQ